MLEDRQDVFKVEDPRSSAIKPACTVGVTRVHGVGDIVKQLGIDHIPHVGVSICSANRQAFPCRGADSALQPIVVGVAFVRIRLMP